ncbi:hypothetical protein FGADI_10485 [Fusarium gaditjirri]|uniref:Chromo domain-containing protein n=1 Tax=Fusarium gaditjirri TaxID=282569 RepID=A0A8H4SXD7_9HYPO|nr:hypothetical protein FGADI_10485 [Fusarium gaditjirri]
MATNNQNNRLYAIERFMRHRVNRRTNTVEILVKWAGYREQTWEPEANLQKTAGRTLYRYWRHHGGRVQATGLQASDVFKIHSKVLKRGEWYFHCQWVGYPNSKHDSSLEPEDKIMEIAPAAVADFAAREAARLARLAATNQNAVAANP